MIFNIGDLVQLDTNVFIVGTKEVEGETFYEVTFHKDGKIYEVPENVLYKLPTPEDFPDPLDRDAKDIQRENEESDE